MIGVGFPLQADEAFLELCAPLFSEVDYLEVAPETTWREEGGALVENGFSARYRAIGARAGAPFVAHGVGLSLGTLDEEDGPRLARWLSRAALDHALFSFLWYTDHLGATTMGGLHLALPCPVPMTDAFAASTRARLDALAAVLGGATVGVENTANHVTLGDPLEEPAFLRAVLGDRHGLLLDLANVHAMAANLGFDAGEYLRRVDLDAVLEIHVAGGRFSDAAWLPSGRALVLDGHDDAVPEEVWRMLEDVAPRCPRLRGITLERMEGTVEAADVPLLREELRRARRIAERAR